MPDVVAADFTRGAVRHVCPACKGELAALRCTGCGVQYIERSGIPVFLPRDTGFQQAEQISSTYDSIYTDHARVWEDQGREDDFRRFFASLVRTASTGRLLEIGCGEGILLESLPAAEKYAVDISPLALGKARARTSAVCGAALAEMLPFPDCSFDVVVSVGVMEHFLEEDKANAEVHRVLKPGGHYIVLIHVDMTFAQRLRQKIREFIFPRFRPVKLARWIKKKSVKPIHQPIQRVYTIPSAAASLERGRLKVQRTITPDSDPAAPLAGDHVVIYVTRREG